MRLFTEPFDLDEIADALDDDDFISLAFVMTGRQEIWQSALDQTVRLLDLFDAEDRDPRPVYRAVSVLLRRAETFVDTGNKLDELVKAIGLLPGTKFMEAIKSAHLQRIDPDAWQCGKNKKWIEGYKAKMDAIRHRSEQPRKP